MVETEEAWQEHERQKEREEAALRARLARRQRDHEHGLASSTRSPQPDLDPKADRMGSSRAPGARGMPHTAALAQLEDAMPERWGHSGYRQLHPEEFQDDASSGGTCVGADARYGPCAGSTLTVPGV